MNRNVPLGVITLAVSLFSLSSLALTGCSGKTQDSDTGSLFTAPELSHTPADSVAEGGELSIQVLATDADGLYSLSLYHRTGGVSNWTLLPMTPPSEVADTYTATLSGGDIGYPSVEYYIKAVDNAETSSTAYLPADDTTDHPFSVPVAVQGAALPFVEDFEADDTGTASDLTSLGWGAASTEFRGYPWQTSQVAVHSGSNSAFHPQGYEGAEPSRDWLVSPAIDLTGTGAVQVTWQEYGNFIEKANHALYISTTSNDPADGGYSLVSTLPAPLEDAWGRSDVYDLSAFAGSTVYLSWYFEGSGADDWYIDDIRVEALQADLSETWSIAPNPVHPGESTTLTVTVTNTATIDADDVAVGLSFPSGGIGATAESIDIGTVPAGGSTTAEFTLNVESSQTDNRYVPMDIALNWGANEEVGEEQFIVGYASVATLGWTAAADGSVELVVGVGDPDAPTWSGTVYADNAVAGELTASLDVTDAGDFLPAAAGDLRWWVSSTTAAGGSFTDFTLSYAGAETSATVFPIVAAGESDVCWLPEPPSFTVSARTTPTVLSPGQAGVPLTLMIQDTGSTTSGPVTATLSSTDVDVIIHDGGPLAVSADVMHSLDQVTVSGFSFDVTAAHTDSTDVSLDLTLDDGVESWLVPLSFDVPYPVLTVTSVEINDDGGDGMLDPGESGTLTINLTNTGDLNALGAVSGVLSVAGTSVATADPQTGSEVFGSLAAGSTQDARFDITVTGGAVGDPLDLALALSDSTRTYSSSTQLILGEPPWSAISTEDDADNDALDGWDFDMVNGSYRVMDGMMQVRMRSAEPFDPSSLFIEGWGLSSAADYDYYRVVAQSGYATLQGYDGNVGFISLPDPTLSYPDAYTVQLDFPLSDLGLFSSRLSLGFGSGWCGEPEYYCDNFPDGWGYPYDSFDPGLWFSLEW